MNPNTSTFTQKFIKLPKIEDYSEKDFDKNFILDTLEEITKETLGRIVETHKQGFIDLEVSNVISLSEAFRTLYDTFAFSLVLNQNIGNIMNHLQKSFLLNYKNQPEITHTLQQVLAKLEAKLIFSKLQSQENAIFLAIENYNLFTFIYMPKAVKLVSFKKEPEALIKSLLMSKDINFFINKDQISYEIPYTLDVIKQRVSTQKMSLKNYEKPIKIDTKNFKIGLQINDLEDLKNVSNHRANFIYIEPEKAYIKYAGILEKESRIEFYKSLYEAYKDTEIILVLPKLDVLNKYHFSDQDYILDKSNFLKHYFMYIEELDAATITENPNLKISIPSLTDDFEFKELKSQVKQWLKMLKRSIPNIGFSIETDSSYDYSEYFKKFDFACIDLDRIYDEISMSDDIKLFYKDISFLNQQLKIRKKEVYLIGKDLKSYDIIRMLVKKGFKNFVINPEMYPYLEQIITEYNLSRGKFKKIK
ncbi:hypothetical protein [Acholeplasma hippikon]|uniref:Uncharacterized protein n=1 Tax=Acholeplasma hippikon TaxID=264636 RepID=A0A449BKM8_9MOLU|nr:hypothetical protein [Acholeplasma hippikon]VEU82980.1 Uncharacterised protein [Acholeplasma hippikon]